MLVPESSRGTMSAATERTIRSGTAKMTMSAPASPGSCSVTVTPISASSFLPRSPGSMWRTW